MDVTKALLMVAQIEHELQALKGLPVGQVTPEEDNLPPIRLKVGGETFELGPEGIPVKKIRGKTG